MSIFLVTFFLDSLLERWAEIVLNNFFFTYRDITFETTSFQAFTSICDFSVTRVAAERIEVKTD